MKCRAEKSAERQCARVAATIKAEWSYIPLAMRLHNALNALVETARPGAARRAVQRAAMRHGWESFAQWRKRQSLAP